MHGMMYVVIFWLIMCDKVDFFCFCDVDAALGSHIGVGFEVGFKYGSGYDNVNIANNYFKCGVD